MGFFILFVLVALFNTVTLRLAAPPYALGSGPLGFIFAVYLLGAVITLTGLALTLTAPLALVVLGLVVAACGVFVAQAAALSAVQAGQQP